MEWTFSDSVRLSLLSFSEASKACAALPGFSLFRRDCHNSHGTLQTEKQRTGLNSSVSHADGFSHFPFPALSVHSFLPVASRFPSRGKCFSVWRKSVDRSRRVYTASSSGDAHRFGLEKKRCFVESLLWT